MQFKKVPDGRVWFCAELEDAIALGRIKIIFVGSMNFVEKKNHGMLHYYLFRADYHVSEED